MLNLPNLITIARLLLVPVLVWVLWQERYAPALAVFLIAGLSDAVDGFLARHFSQVTRFGAILDPVADKAIILAALITLTALGQFPLWLMLPMVGRDLVILGGAAAYRTLAGHLEMAPTLLGKLHTFFAFTLLCLVLANAALIADASAWLPLLFDILLATTVFSAANYVWVWGRKARRFTG